MLHSPFGSLVDCSRKDHSSGLPSREFLSRINLMRCHRFAVGRSLIIGSPYWYSSCSVVFDSWSVRFGLLEGGVSGTVQINQVPSKATSD
jgi:hypothetical protein